MERSDVLQGTLDMLILKAVSLGELHGYGILLRIQQISGQALLIPQGSLYPALYRLQRRGWIQSRWGESENHRKARFYSLTETGKRQLKVETERWDRLSGAISSVLDAGPQEV